jgi:hypothetical protein
MAKKIPGTVIQYGSGHPGEEGSAQFERELFQELNLKDPNVLFFPFHSMPPHSGDMARFERIYGDLTNGWIRSIQLEPPRWPINTAEIFTLLEEAQVVVLGSGFPEPFSRLMFRLGLPQRLRAMQRKGVHFLGYSAGTLTLSEGYYLPFTGQDLIIQLDMLDHISMPDPKRIEMEDQMISVLDRKDARSFVEGVRAFQDADQELDKEQKSFLNEPLWMEQAKGFCLTPGLTANPHFGEPIQYREIHLRHLSQIFPDLLHVGIPNACALVSSTQSEKKKVTFRGHNPRRQAAYKKGNAELVPLQDGDLLPE